MASHSDHAGTRRYERSPAIGQAMGSGGYQYGKPCKLVLLCSGTTGHRAGSRIEEVIATELTSGRGARRAVVAFATPRVRL